MFASTFRWLQRKRYQYEVTFSLYMLTPTEKFIFNSFIFLFFSMILIACSLYLPQHIAWVTNRAWFYYHGDENSKIVSERDPMKQMTEAVLERVTRSVGSLVMETARVTATAVAVKGEL